MEKEGNILNILKSYPARDCFIVAVSDLSIMYGLPLRHSSCISQDSSMFLMLMLRIAC